MIYRNLTTGRIEPLPWRVRLADGTTRTDPEQWSSDLEALAAAGYEETTRTPADDAHDLEQAKAAKVAAIDAEWNRKIGYGWTPPGQTWRLGIDIPDVTLLLGAYTLSKDANALGLPDEVPIVDLDGVSHVMDSQSITPLMLQYGAARASLSAIDAAARQAVAAATTIEEVNAVEVG